jgi:apolipoprotein N-acyltransferase
VRELPWRAACLGLCSAILFTLAFPPFELAPLSWVALVPLFVVVVRVAATEREIAWASGAFGIVVYGVNLRWFSEIFGPSAIVFWAVLAWLLARTLWLAWRIGQRWGDRALVLALPILWVGLEHFRSECWQLKFGWITPGYAQASDLFAVQAAEIVGVYGLSFVVVLVSALAAWGITRPSASARTRTLAIIALPLTYATLYAYGAHRIATFVDEGPPIRVAAVQYETNRFEEAEAMLDQVPSGTQLVVLPELGAVYREGQLTYVDARARRLAGRAGSLGAVLVVGSERRAPGDQPLTDFYNTLAIADSSGTVDYYTKAEPVPLFADGVPSDDVHAYDTSLGRIGFAICYDFTHPHVVDQLVGARAFVVASGDLASWTELQHAQHALVTHLRAIEHRRWVVRATSSGFSQIVDPLGRVTGELGFEAVGILPGEIRLRDETTLYDLALLWPARLAMALWAAAIALELVLWWRARQR